MKRILAIKLVVFLLLGAVVNVAVAWSSVWWAPLPTVGTPGRFAGSAQGKDYKFLRVHRDRRLGAERLTSTWIDPTAWQVSLSFLRDSPHEEPEDLVPAWGEFLLPSNAYAGWTFHTRIVEARGWPILCAVSEYAHCRTPLDGWNDRSIDQSVEHFPNGVLISHAARHRRSSESLDYSTLRQLPFYPLFSGFLINTLFYATVLWFPFAPFAIRRLIRWRRASRGLCVRCGYDLRHADHDVCPECGSGR